MPKSVRRSRDRSTAVPWVRSTELKFLPLPQPVVVVNGAFDILHAGHMRTIFTARMHGQTVIVALDSDEKVRREKGEARPILSFAERVAALEFMPIDLIVPIESKADMNRVMAIAQLRVQSDEYAKQPSRYAVPKLFVRDSRMHDSHLIERILRKHGKTP